MNKLISNSKYQKMQQYPKLNRLQGKDTRISYTQEIMSPQKYLTKLQKWNLWKWRCLKSQEKD
jgi:hypothetical protein